MQITLTIPDNIATRVINAMCSVNGYQGTVKNAQGEDISNPETKAQFAKRMIINYAKDSVRAAESLVAADTARQSAINSVNSEITIT